MAGHCIRFVNKTQRKAVDSVNSVLVAFFVEKRGNLGINAGFENEIDFYTSKNPFGIILKSWYNAPVFKDSDTYLIA